MTYTYNHETREVHLDLSITEFDLLIALKFAAYNYISPLKPGSDYEKFIRQIEDINRKLASLRIQK